MSNVKFNRFNDHELNLLDESGIDKMSSIDDNQTKKAKYDIAKIKRYFDYSTSYDIQKNIKKIQKIVNKNPLILNYNIPNTNTDMLQYMISKDTNNKKINTIFPLLKLVRQTSQKTYLHSAILKNKPEKFLFELVDHVDINEQNTNGRTVAFFTKNKQLFDLFIKKGINLNIKDANGNTFYQFKLLTKRDPSFLNDDIFDQFNICYKNKDNQSVLSLCLSLDYPKQANAIIKSKNFHIEKLNFDRTDPFMLIIESSFDIEQKKIFLFNLSKKENTDNILLHIFKYYDTYHNIFSNFDRLNLYIEYIILNSKPNRTKILLEKTDKNGNNILHKLSFVNNENLIKFILRKKYNAALNFKNKDGLYPIDLYNDNSFEQQMNQFSDKLTL